MPEHHAERTRYFLTYRGVGLPLRLAEELDAAGVEHRGTFYRASYDAAERLVRCEKIVYGEVELEHVYEYDAQGTLLQAKISSAGDEPQIISFAERISS